MTDTHAHLDACEAPDDVVERAHESGVMRIVTIGTGIESSRAALALADRHDGVFAALGVDPHQASTPEAGRIEELRELLVHPKAVAVGETGLDNARQYASPEDQRRLLDAQLELADELSLPVVIHSRDAAEETAAALAGFVGTVVLHCFSSPGLLPAAVERGYYVSFAGNVDVSEGLRAPRRSGRRYPTTASSSRPTRRTSRRSRFAGVPTSPRTCRTRSRRWLPCAASRPHGSPS